MTYIPKPSPPQGRIVSESGKTISPYEVKDGSEVDWALVVNSLLIIGMVIGVFLTLVIVRLIDVF